MEGARSGPECKWAQMPIYNVSVAGLGDEAHAHAVAGATGNEGEGGESDALVVRLSRVHRPSKQAQVASERERERERRRAPQRRAAVVLSI